MRASGIQEKVSYNKEENTQQSTIKSPPPGLIAQDNHSVESGDAS